MGVDYLQTLNPALGLARSVRVLPPDGTNSLLWTVAVDIGQERPDESNAGIDMSWVGAAGVRRAPTFARATGEAVERRALIPHPGLPNGAGLPIAPRGVSWADISALPNVDVYAATRYDGDGRERAVAVPAAAVDFPRAATPGAQDLFDPSPSGTAAGISRATAEQSAAKEIIERHAAMRGWDRPEAALRFELADAAFEPISGAPRPRSAGPDARVLDVAKAAASQGVELELVLLDESHGHAVWMAVAIDTKHGVVGAGLGLEHDRFLGVLRAVQESLQIRSLLINLKDSEGERPMAPPITSEMARARYWAADASITAIRTWLDRIPRASHSLVSDAEASAADGQQGAWPDILAGYTLIDLTPRLPQAIREMGWCAVKIFCDTLQPLRMSEALEWNVLGAAAAGNGLPGNPLPHPFI
ncbi:YcaO-like family protein [Arthrobacter sp. fls2-241-R2A-200]|uniref:YcaO-like family protein n=1 Tax=Arthrobacter sp. fls2-241-R2A-200 TaxID=3040281 RepID=UPI00254B4778|nr:YcaO-like family protein [Arthrobacter sp. fls2-241-R2A-200]